MKKSTWNVSMSRHSLMFLALSASLIGTVAQAEEKKPDNEWTSNLSLTSDYRFRGISQTRLEPAVQGGIDYTHNPTGLYAGIWASNIKWIKDAGGDASFELDVYGGKKGEITKEVSYDIGALAYVYPGNGLFPNTNTYELYGQLGYGVGYLKYSYAVSNAFGFRDSKGSGYLDGGVNFEVAKDWNVNMHVGHQAVRNNSFASYTDYKIGVTHDFGVATFGLAFYYANTDAYLSRDGKNLGKSGAVFSVSKTFN